MRDRILRKLDDRQNEMIELLRELIMIPSLSGQEKPIAKLLAMKLKEFGFEHVKIDGLNNVIGELVGNQGKPVLLYNGHTDVVPLGDVSLWPADPLKAPIVDDKIIGRGACDMKGSIAAMIVAGSTVKNEGKLRGNLILSMVSREEEGLAEGTRYTIEEDGLKPDIALVGEATNLDLCLFSRGGTRIEVSVKGRAAHPAHPSKGTNAITKMSKMIDAIANMKLPTHESFGTTTQAITNITCEPSKSNVIPSLCSISISRRMVPSDSLEKTKAEFAAIVDKLKEEDPEFDADVKIGKPRPQAYLPPEESVVKQLQESAKYVLGRYPKISHYRFGTDGSYLGGIANIPWFGFGPGDESNAHTVNDHVKIDDLVAASKVYAMFIIDLLS